MYRSSDVIVKYRRSVTLLGLAFTAAAVHVFVSGPTVPLGHTGKTTAQPLVRSGTTFEKQSHLRPFPQQSAHSRFAEQTLGDYIHSTASFQQQLHQQQEPPIEQCSCPSEPDATSEMAALQRLAELHTPQLPMPTRIQPLPPGPYQHPQIFDHFGEVYAINLPTRPDRRHYACSVLQRLNISALLWPAFSKYTTAVRTYAVQRRTSFPNPVFANEPPLAPAPPDPDADPDPTHRSSRPPRPPTFLRAQIACFVSHREVWFDIAAKDFRRPVLILEDDIDPDLNFVESVAAAIRSVPDDWAILWVGHCFEEMQDHTGARVGHRLYKARGPACTHAYALRNATVAQHFVDAIGHDVNRPVDLAMIALLKAHHLPGYVMLPPPVSQLWRTDKRKYVKANNTNPSDVVALGLKLPMQRVLHPVREALLREAAAAAGLPASAVDGPDGEGLLCGNSLFHLAPPDDAPDELAVYTASDFLP